MAAEPMAEGETVLLLDRAGNRRLITLRAGAKAHGHKGYLEHDRMIGQPEGIVARASSGATYLVMRPRLADYALEMPRRTAIIYPKDVGIILVWADIYPGATVVESGLGSGSLTLALLRAVGPTGQVIVYEQRGDLIPAALTNISKYYGPSLPSAPMTMPAPTAADLDDEAAPSEDGEPPASVSQPPPPPLPPNLIVRKRDIYAGVEETEIDRMVLDLPEPWRVLPHALDSLRPGGMLACYSPSIIQVQRTVEALEETGAFAQVESLEVLYRPWQIKGQAVRPVQQMVSHTAFLTFARRLAARGRRPGEEPLPDEDEHSQAHQDDASDPGQPVG